MVEDCPPGTTIQMLFSEVLCGFGSTRWSLPCTGITGTVDQRNLRGDWATSYICKGGSREVYEPRYTYTGHRFVELRGFPGTPTADSLQQRVVHSDVETAPTNPLALAGAIAFGDHTTGVASLEDVRCYEGEGCGATWAPLESGAVLLNQIAHNSRWTLIDNLHSVPEDCDQRPERMGWMADGSVSAEGNYVSEATVGLGCDCCRDSVVAANSNITGLPRSTHPGSRSCGTCRRVDRRCGRASRHRGRVATPM